MSTDYEVLVEVITSLPFLGVLFLAAMAALVLSWDRFCPEDPIERILKDINKKKK